MMARSDVGTMTSLLNQFFNHAERYLKSTGDLLVRRISPIIGFENSLP